MVYFVKSNDKVKIGFSNNPQARIGDIQVSNPYKLDVLLIIDGDFNRENELHQQFREYRINGEWFDFSEPIESFINDNKQDDRRYEFGFIPNGFLGNNQLARLRKENKMRLRHVGDLIGIKPQSVYEMEKRENDGFITINSMNKYANVLGYKLEYRFVPIND